MPPVHTSAFRVRSYECDAYGHVNHANYLRYMQEAAFDASQAVGYGARRTSEIGYQWLAYETEIEYLHPVVYGDTLEIKTWVVDFRRVRSLRRYEFYVREKLVAHGATDWVLIDLRQGMPAAIPPEIIAAYAPGEAVQPAPARPPFPPAPAPPPDVFTLRRRVTWEEIDAAGHVNNAVYLNYITDGGMQASRIYGWPVNRLRAEGIGIVARQHQIEYKAAAALDDELEIITWLSDMKRATGVRHYKILRLSDQKLLARVRSLCVWIDLHSGEPRRIPQPFLDDLAPNITSASLPPR
jgi:acyl-CoA thioester hydrolase